MPRVAPAFELRDYQLIFHETGAVTVFTRGNLVYFVKPGTVTIYRPTEGLLVRLPYDASAIGGDPDGTRSVDFSAPPRGGPAQTPLVIAIRDPVTLRFWDDVARQPASQRDFRFLDDDPRRQSGYAVVGELPAPQGGDDVFETVERYLGDARERDRYAYAQKLQEEIDAATRAGPDGVARLAARRFAQASALPKQAGTTVCSADNRIGYIREVDGARIFVIVRGHAVGRHREFGAFGPFDTALFERPDGQPHAISDPYFLFLPLTGAMKFVRVEEPQWDLGRLWGVCGYQ